MARPVTDRIGRWLIVIFLIKPVIDLFPGAAIWLGALRLAPTTVFGALVFVAMLPLLFGRGRHVPPFGRLFEAFIVVNVISVVLGIVSGRNPGVVTTINTTLRILDAYVVYSAAYLAARRYNYTDVTPFVTAIVVGSAIVVVLNVVAVNFGITGFVRQAGPDVSDYGALRQRGLYYDPGGLGNVAFFSLVFTVFRYHLAKTGRTFWLIFAIVIVFADLYLVTIAKSRAVMIELAVFGVIYMGLYQKAWGKVAAPITLGAIVLLAVLLFGSASQDLFARFDTDVAALEGDSDEDIGVSSSGEVSLGKYERLGSNRGALWAEALSAIVVRGPVELLVGNFAFDASAHSDYIDILGRNGVVGLTIYVVMLGGLVLRTFGYARAARTSHDRNLHFLAFTLVLCYTLYGLPFRSLMYTTTAWYMWTMLAISMATVARQAEVAMAQRAEAARVAPEESVPIAGAPRPGTAP